MGTPISCRETLARSSRGRRRSTWGSIATIDEATVQDIHRRASSLLPALGALHPAERWNGFRPGIEGGVPLIGRVEDARIWTAFGHYRNGILLAPDTARRIEEMVTSTILNRDYKGAAM